MIISLKINLLGIDFAEALQEDFSNESILKSIEDLFSEIESVIEDQDSKHLAKIFLADVLGKVLHASLTSMQIDTKVFQILGGDINGLNKDRVSEFKNIVSLSGKCLKTFNSALDYAKSKKNKFLEAHSNYYLANFNFGHLFANFLAKYKIEDEKLLKELFIQTMVPAINGYNKLRDLHLKPQAYQSLQLAQEVIKLSEYWDVSLSEMDILAIEKEIKAYENLDFVKFKGSLIDEVIKREKELDKRFKDGFSLSNLTEKELQALAKVRMKVDGIPADRFQNVLDDLKSYKLFESRCKNPDLKVHTDQRSRGADAYLEKTNFIIVSSKSNNIYARGYDMEKILKELGF